MTEQIKDGGPAFPSPEWSDAHGTVIPMEYGMTLRDYFAAKAMESLVLHAAQAGYSSAPGQVIPDSQTAYQWADAMLKARESA